MKAKILNASAGSGKTYQLAYKYVHDVIGNPDLYRHILAVTFTNKATEEMKSRILKEIHLLTLETTSSYMTGLCHDLQLDARTVRQRACEVQSKILHDYSRFTVLTIDTFFQRILRAFIKELGIDLNYNVEIETSTLLTRSADLLIEGVTSDERLQKWLMAFIQERIDAGRKWDVREGILSLGKELFKESNREMLSAACPREQVGKIVGRALQTRTKSQTQMQALARQAIEIVENTGLTVNDFPHKSGGFINYFYAIERGQFEGYKTRVMAACDSDEAWGKEGSPARGLAHRLRPLLCQLCQLYDQNLRQWNTATLLSENFRSFALLSDLYTKVQQMCTEENTMLLSQTKYILSEFIGQSDAPFIYEKVGNRFERFMIDEFQDTSIKEWENFLPLLQNAIAQSEQTSVLIVGDIKQSIYRWRGGDWRILHSGVRAALGEQNTAANTLQDNFRSLPTIVDFNNKAIAQIVAEDNTTLNMLLDSALQSAIIPDTIHAELTDTLHDAYRNHAQNARRQGGAPGYVNIMTHSEEAPFVERICELLDRGFRPKDMMILVRDNKEGARVAAKLLSFKQTNTDPRYKIDVMTQEALVVGTAPISSFIIAALRLTLNPDDPFSGAVYNHYLEKSFDNRLNEQERLFFRSIRLLPPEEAFEQIVMRYKLQNDTAQIAYLQAVHEQIITFCANKIADIPLFLSWWVEHGATKSLHVEQGETTIEITTIHKAKGLEKKVVIIPCCNWELSPKPTTAPTVWADAKEEIAGLGRFPVRYKASMGNSLFAPEYYRELIYTHVDNINLLYVALTRAAESLHIFIPTPKKPEDASTVGQLLLHTLLLQGEQCELCGTRGEYIQNNGYQSFIFGKFQGPMVEQTKESTEHILLDDYTTSQADLRLRLPSQRYFLEEQPAELSPRNFGILMHKAFENASTRADIDQSIAQMLLDGIISQAEGESLRQMIDKALANPITGAWFDSDWEQIRNEQEIILPGGSNTRRPDRVMIRGTHAVVVDYKFGRLEQEKYRTQIREYMSLLHGIGYTQTDGYLWYVKLGILDKVEA